MSKYFHPIRVLLIRSVAGIIISVGSLVSANAMDPGDLNTTFLSPSESFDLIQTFQSNNSVWGNSLEWHDPFGPLRFSEEGQEVIDEIVVRAKRVRPLGIEMLMEFQMADWMYRKECVEWSDMGTYCESERLVWNENWPYDPPCQTNEYVTPPFTYAQADELNAWRATVENLESYTLASIPAFLAGAGATAITRDARAGFLTSTAVGATIGEALYDHPEPIHAGDTVDVSVSVCNDSGRTEMTMSADIVHNHN